MIKIGEMNKMEIVREASFGYYLNAGTGRTSDDILLPMKDTRDMQITIGDSLDVFVYLDSKDRLIATTKEPLAKVGDFAMLKVVDSTHIGSFVDIGLERDVLVPFKEKLYPLETGKSYLFYLYVDKTGRIAATTRLDKYLLSIAIYKPGDSVKGTVYGFQTNGSAMVAVDNKYNGVILKNEYFNELNIGDTLDLNVIKVYEDGKLGLTPRKTGKEERTELQDVILDYLKSHDGFMAYNDKTSPDEIYKVFNVSKNNFKNALGGLMKKNLIKQDKSGTTLL